MVDPLQCAVWLLHYTMTITEAAKLLRVHPNTIKTYLLKHILRGKVMKQLIEVPAHKRYHFVTVIEDESVRRLLDAKNK